MRFALLCLLLAAQSKPVTRLTGCLDQDEDRFVLRGLVELRKIVTLSPLGFDKDAFAKYVGQKVEVEGRMKPGEDAVFEVKAVKKVADVCEPE